MNVTHFYGRVARAHTQSTRVASADTLSVKEDEVANLLGMNTNFFDILQFIEIRRIWNFESE